MSSSSYEFPSIYSFPPFFTYNELKPILPLSVFRKQVHEETWRKQLELWTEVLMGYCEAKRIFSLDWETAVEPFQNGQINRRASNEMVKALLDHLVQQNLGEWLPKSSTCLIYWRKPSEWANGLHEYISASGQLGSIVTVYELFQGDDTAGQPFHGLPEVFWSRVLAPLRKAGKVAVFGAAAGSDSAPITPETGLKFT